jgi:hypothetical protein
MRDEVSHQCKTIGKFIVLRCITIVTSEIKQKPIAYFTQHLHPILISVSDLLKNDFNTNGIRDNKSRTIRKDRHVETKGENCELIQTLRLGNLNENTTTMVLAGIEE